jgi:hypothetical protein
MELISFDPIAVLTLILNDQIHIIQWPPYIIFIMNQKKIYQDSVLDQDLC